MVSVAHTMCLWDGASWHGLEFLRARSLSSGESQRVGVRSVFVG